VSTVPATFSAAARVGSNKESGTDKYFERFVLFKKKTFSSNSHLPTVRTCVCSPQLLQKNANFTGKNSKLLGFDDSIFYHCVLSWLRIQVCPTILYLFGFRGV